MMQHAANKLTSLLQ